MYSIKSIIKKGFLIMFKASLYRLPLIVTLFVMLCTIAPHHIHARSVPPALWLPTPIGEEWEILQGFNIGTHAGERELDFVRTGGGTVGAPVRAAASGTVYFWTASSGTLLLYHGNNYYTEYTHLGRAYVTAPGTRVRQGEEIGTIGGTAHLHFSLYYSSVGSYFSRETLELYFGDGYDFSDIGGSNQHAGEQVVARERDPDTTPPTIAFETDIEAEQWYCRDRRIEFVLSDDQWAEGFSQAFDDEPDTQEPEFRAEAGYVQASWAGEGMHTLMVRGWDGDGNTMLASLGPFGYDAAPPMLNAPEEPPEKRYQLNDDATLEIAWEPASDGDGSGVQGYRYYLGSEDDGVSDDVSETNNAILKGIDPGCYLLRVQPFDVCSEGEWVTLQKIVVNDASGTLPEGACGETERDEVAGDEDEERVEDVTATKEPTEEPTATATKEPTEEPTATATKEPTATATKEPTATATKEPTKEPTATKEPTKEPTATKEPTEEPTATSNSEPSAIPAPLDVDSVGDESSRSIEDVSDEVVTGFSNPGIPTREASSAPVFTEENPLPQDELATAEAIQFFWDEDEEEPTPPPINGNGF